MNAEHISEAKEAIHRHPATREALRDALLELLKTARREFVLVSPMLDPSHWNTAEFTNALSHFIVQHPQAQVRMVVEDTEHLLTACTRLVEFTRRYSDRIRIQRLGEAQRGLTGLFAVADHGHCLVQHNLEQADATLDLHAPRLTAPWRQRFEEIWNGAEPAPGLHGFRL